MASPSSAPAPGPHARQAAAFLAWLNSSELVDPHEAPASSAENQDTSLKAWYDPAKLWRVCQTVDATHFTPENDIDTLLDVEDRLESLKELYEAVMTYYREKLRLTVGALPGVDLDAIACESSEDELIQLVTQILAMAVMSPSKEAEVTRIQSLPQWMQRELMLCIETVRSKLSSPDPSNDLASASFSSRPSDDSLSTYADLQTTHRALQTSHEALKRELADLRDTHEDFVASHQNAATAIRTRAAQDSTEERTEQALRGEIDRLQKELGRTETLIADLEAAASRYERREEELTKRVEELSGRADQADRLADQVDEYRHAVDKLRKMETAVEKYKKKLEESAEARRLVRSLEEENLSLLEKNAALEEQYAGVSQFKDLMENYKSTIAGLEKKTGDLLTDKENVQHELTQTKDRLAQLEETYTLEKETVALLEERVSELEVSAQRTLDGETKGKKGVNRGAAGAPGQNEISETSSDYEHDLSGVANELDDVLSGRSTTELKLQIRKLRRELAAAQANKADASKIVVLENLLEDARKMKARYEEQYLAEHRAKLVLSSQLEKIRSGKSESSDSGEAALALRIRLNETVEDYERARAAQIAAEEKLQVVQKELVIAKSDLALVDKDQLDVLHSLRASVSTEKTALEAELDVTKQEVAKLSQTATMQLSQINTLLMDKVALQSDELTQRERLLEKEQGRAQVLGPSAGLTGSEAAAELERLKADLAKKQKELESVKEKFQKAKHFIRQQDKLFKDQHAAMQSDNPFEAAEQAYKAQIQALQDEVDRQRTLHVEMEQKYQKEQRLMLTAWQENGMDRLRAQVAQNGHAPSRSAPASWLAQQRARALARNVA